jgi:ribosome maturation factor RimP
LVDINKTITQIANDHLKDDSFFIVDVIVKSVSDKTKILVLLDCDGGLNIDDCAQLSRNIANQLEEDELMDIAFILEVSSPGLDHPLLLKRQYMKNIGRSLKLTATDGEISTGKLLKVADSSIEFDKEIKEKKKVSYKTITIPFNEIEKASILVSFK